MLPLNAAKIYENIRYNFDLLTHENLQGIIKFKFYIDNLYLSMFIYSLFHGYTGPFFFHFNVVTVKLLQNLKPTLIQLRLLNITTALIAGVFPGAGQGAIVTFNVAWDWIT